MLLIVVVLLSVSLVQSKSIECGPVCEIFCLFGNVLDARGCPTCNCKQNPCPSGSTLLENRNCGPTNDDSQCPSNYSCVSSFCCSRSSNSKIEATGRNLVKIGSCPPPSGLYGVCIARCSSDSDCPENLKCCGSCPRTCVPPS